MKDLSKKKNPKNYPGYENPRYIEILEKSLLEPNKSKRFDLLRDAEELLNQDMPLTALFHWKNGYLQKPYIKNLLINPSGTFHLQQISFLQGIKEDS